LNLTITNLAAVLIWVIAAAVATWDLTVSAGILAACLGAIAGNLLGANPLLLRAPNRVRLWIPWTTGIAAIVLFALAARALRGVVWLSSVFGPTLVYSASEALFWFAAFAIAVGLIQFTRRRFRLFGLAELACLGAIFASALRAHRDGFLNRPFFFVDPLWSRGIDPLPALMGAGLLVLGLAIAAVTLGARKAGAGSKNLIRNGIFIAAVLALVFFLIPKGILKYLPDQTKNSARQELKDKNPGGGGGKGDKKEDAKPQDGKDNQSGSNQGPEQKQGQVGRENQAGNQSGKPHDPSDQENQKGGGSPQEHPIAVVTFRSDYNSPYGVYYFRETAFSAYNGLRLVRDVGNLDSDLANTFPAPVLELDTPPMPEKISTTVALMQTDARPLSLVNAFKLTEAPNPSPNRFLRAYDVQSYVVNGDLKPLLGAKVGDPKWSDEARRHYLDAPKDPRYRKLAEEALNVLPEDQRDRPIARAAAVVNLLNETGTYGELEENANHNQPLENFLFGNRTGICIEFAHSATLMFRALGVPARVGAGYAIPVKQRGEGSSVLIRDGDAHAWPEVYVQGRGWIVLDVTPKKTIAPPRAPVDAGLQQMMGDMARESPLNGKDTTAGDNGEGMAQTAQNLWTMLKWLALLGLVGLYLTNLWRRYEVYFCSEDQAPWVAYRVLMQRMGEAGRRRLFGETRESYAHRNAPICPVLNDFTKWHLESAFGSAPVRLPRNRYLEMHRAAVRQLSTQIPWWRRALGVLNPISAWRNG
jgi:transglutaminase-like putative cysteine protease